MRDIALRASMITARTVDVAFSRSLRRVTM
jgi:hypothetical protein